MSLLGTMFHDKRLGLAVIISLLLGLAACGGEVSTQQMTNTPSGNESAEIQTGAEEASETQSGRGGTLRVAMQPVVNIDPIAISSDSEVLVANHVYDYLIDIDHLSNPVPRLATGWDISDDGLTYTLPLAEDVTWHDGSEFSAADVVWTFERLRTTEGAPTFDLYSNIASIEATGDLEVTFKLTKPNPFFLYDLSDNHALILKAGTTDADTNFNGTGPFVVTNYRPEERIEMVANENYFIPEQPGDFTGHADGMIRFLDEHTVLVNDYSKEKEWFRRSFEIAVHNTGLEAITIPYNVYENKSINHANGDYINYLQMKDIVFVPIFGMKEDEVVVKQFDELFQRQRIETIDSNEIAFDGGILNCITWNVLKG